MRARRSTARVVRVALVQHVPALGQHEEVGVGHVAAAQLDQPAARGRSRRRP